MVDILEFNTSDYAEVDPTGRYRRNNEILSKCPSAAEFMAFDEYNGIEVAWFKAKLSDSFKNAEKLAMLQKEMNSLKDLNHRNIAKLHASWVDSSHQTINIITETFTSGSLKQFRQKHRGISMKAVKNWCRQILQGLVYLHNGNPILIHEDLKCDNIFVNGNHGEVKIGIVGLSVILQNPDYREPRDELDDVYAFGMCVVEIYTGIQTNKHDTKADSLAKINNPEVRKFVGKCFAELPHRLSAAELLDDPFLSLDGSDVSSTSLDLTTHDTIENGFLNCFNFDDEKDDGFDGEVGIKGKRADDGSIFLRLRITDKTGTLRNIHFLFEVENDTALTVATEMVAELDMDQDVVKIADLIDREIASLVPGWVSHTDIDTDTDTDASSYTKAYSCRAHEQTNDSCCDCSDSDDVMGREGNDGLRNMRWMRGLRRLERRELEDGRLVNEHFGRFCDRAMWWTHCTTSLPVDAVGYLPINKLCHLYNSS